MAEEFTSAEQAALSALGALTIRLPSAIDAELQRNLGMSHFEFAVLRGLGSAPSQTRRMSDLAGLAGGSLSRLSHAVTRLEGRGWVRRAPDPEDGRYTRAALTTAGARELKAAAPAYEKTVRSMVLDVLTPAQLGQLARIGSQVVDRLGPGGNC